MSQFAKLKIAHWKHKGDEFQIENSFEVSMIRLPTQIPIKVNECYTQRLYKKRNFPFCLLGEWQLIAEGSLPCEAQYFSNLTDKMKNEQLSSLETHVIFHAKEKYGLI